MTYEGRIEGVRSREEAIRFAERHIADGDPKGYGYEHCDWCGDEWPCTTAFLLEMVTDEASAPEKPSDTPTFQYMARRSGKSDRLIDLMLAQADARGIRVEVLYPQGEPANWNVHDG